MGWAAACRTVCEFGAALLVCLFLPSFLPSSEATTESVRCLKQRAGEKERISRTVCEGTQGWGSLVSHQVVLMFLQGELKMWENFMRDSVRAQHSTAASCDSCATISANIHSNMSKTCRNTNQVCPPIFNDENECPTYAEDKHVAPGKGSVKSSCFPSDKGVLSEMMKAAKMDMSKMTKADAKGVDGKAVSRRGGAFGRLLSDVTNEQNAEQCERDEKHALDVQCDDALAMASQWMQMDADEKLAQQTQKDQEAENAKALEEKAAAIAIGERAALQVAIQERKNLAAAAQAKLKQEEEDSQHARMSVLQDVEAEHELKTLCEGDADAAKKVYDELQDELFAERLQEQEKKEAALALEKRKAVEYEQALADFEFARQTQISLDVRHAEEQSAQERQDAAMALKFAIVASRQEHRRIKRVQLVQSSSLFNTIQKIGQQWEEAEAQVEDVAGGLCLTLVLPYLRDLKLKASKNNTVDLEAFRIVGKEEHEKGA